jgi:hypothetical protein
LQDLIAACIESRSTSFIESEAGGMKNQDLKKKQASDRAARIRAFRRKVLARRKN